jgi:hypothetical protein
MAVEMVVLELLILDGLRGVLEQVALADITVTAALAVVLTLLVLLLLLEVVVVVALAVVLVMVMSAKGAVVSASLGIQV